MRACACSTGLGVLHCKKIKITAVAETILCTTPPTGVRACYVYEKGIVRREMLCDVRV